MPAKKRNPKKRVVRRTSPPSCSAPNCPSDKSLLSAWLRMNKWCDYHRIETVRSEGGFLWECQIGYVVSRSPDLLRAIAETHRKVKSIHRHQQKPNPKVEGRREPTTSPKKG